MESRDTHPRRNILIYIGRLPSQSRPSNHKSTGSSIIRSLVDASLATIIHDNRERERNRGPCSLQTKISIPRKNNRRTPLDSTDHKQLVRILEFLGLPNDFTRLVCNLYSGASTEFVTPHKHTPPVGVRRGTLKGDPLAPLLFNLMIETRIHWLNDADKGYE
jgi:hypothetical protein